MQMTSPDRFQVQLDEFSECILNRKQPEFPADDALRNMASILAMYESIDTGSTASVVADMRSPWSRSRPPVRTVPSHVPTR